MRLPFIVLMVLAAALAFYFFAAGTGHVQGWKVDAPDPNHIDAWQPPPLAASVGDLVAPFAPHAKFGVTAISLGPNAAQALVATPASNVAEKMEISKFRVTDRGALGVSYNCTSADSPQCPVVSCLCEPGAILTPLRTATCPSSFSQVSAGGVCGAGAKASGSIVVYPDARNVAVFNLGPQPVTATVK